VNSDLYAVRPLVDADFEAVARLNELIDPGYGRTAEEIRHWRKVETEEPGHFLKERTVEERSTGTVVAYGSLSHTSFNFHPDKYGIFVVVFPAFQRQGIGPELYSILEREAVRRKAVCLWAGARDDVPADVRFFGRNGFRTVRKLWRSRLEVANANLTAVPDRTEDLARQGIRVTTLAAEGAEDVEVRRRLYELNRIGSADAPHVGDYQPVSYEQFLAIEIENPDTLSEAYFIAAEDELYVGMTSLARDLARPDTVHIDFTATLPSHRRRGIASQLKRQAVVYARDHGIRHIVTSNDSLNAPIWAINQKLGFQKQVTWLEGEKTLDPAGRAV
jgi:mycothiol synthase